MTPSPDDNIILTPSMMCDDHQSMCHEWDIPIENILEVTLDKCIRMDKFSEIAYRLKNGYAPPDGMDDIPDGEKPGVIHINKTLEELSPICCWMIERSDNPWQDENAPDFIAILAYHKAEVME